MYTLELSSTILSILLKSLNITYSRYIIRICGVG